MKPSRKGFTLIEVLVVISILGVLMGLVSVLVMKSGQHRKKQDARSTVQGYLPGLIEDFKREFKKYPPVSLKELNAIAAFKNVQLPENDTNTCIELLVVALRHPDFTRPLEDGDLPGQGIFKNTDGDIFTVQPAGSPRPEAVEIVDPWGNPYIYIHKNAYKTPVSMVTEDGDLIEVMAVKRSNGQYYNPTSFQIICLGPDGKLDEDPSLGDDIYNFEADDE